MKLTIHLLLLFLTCPLAAFGDPDKVKLVESGRIAEARADWWGFDPSDSTKQLQAAIDSGAKTLLIPRKSSPWIVHPLFLASNQVIVLEPGTVIEAIRGGFKGRTDHLLSARDKENIAIIGPKAVLRMHKKDYQDPSKYQRAEWRHALALYGCRNVRIEGLEIRSSGGDGIYLGSAGRDVDFCRTIAIKDCLIDDNHRQGISVISVENLLIENCVLQNTSGTAPQAGIDFEPNSSRQRLVDITLRNCTFKNNAAAGILISARLDKDSRPISFTFENCRMINDTFTAFLGRGDVFGDSLLSKVNITMTGCTETIDGEARELNEFWSDVMNAQPLTEAQKQALRRLQRVSLTNAKLVPAPGAAPPPRSEMPILRGTAHYVAYAEKGQLVSFSTRVYRDDGGMSVTVIPPSGEARRLGEKVGADEKRVFSFRADTTGLHIIEFALKNGWFGCEAAPESGVRLAMAALNRPIHVFGSRGDFYFHVPAGTREFCVWVAGEGGERVKASLYDAHGNLVDSQDAISAPYRFIVTRQRHADAEVWTLRTEKPAEYYLEDYYIDLLGVPAIFSMDKASLLLPAKQTIRADDSMGE